MSPKPGYSVICYEVFLFLAASKVVSSVIINSCCGTDRVYDGLRDKCEPWLGGGMNQTVNNHTFTVPEAFVKVLNAQDRSNEVNFTLQEHLPTSTCGYGMFQKLFCIKQNETDCANGTERLMLTTRGELRVGKQYYSALEYCVTRLDENSIEFRICNPTCTDKVPCVRKCCDVDEIVNLDGDDGVACEPSDSVAWQPHFYFSARSPLRDADADHIRPHYFISRPRDWCMAPENVLLLEQRDEVTGKLNWLFRLGTRQNIFRRSTRYSWTELTDTWNYSCFDGTINSEYLAENETDIFEGLEEEDMLLECWPDELHPRQEPAVGPRIMYGGVMIVACLFVLTTLVVYLLLWKRLKAHDWTLMSYCFSLFLTYFFHVWRYVHSFVATRTDQVDPICAFIAIALNFSFISTFCWLTMINVDIWWTFRKLKMRRKPSRAVKRYLTYAAVAFGIPTAFVVNGIVLDLTYGNDPESGVVIPEYGKRHCGEEPEYAQLTLRNGLFWLFILFVNIFFFASTTFSIYRVQEGAKLGRRLSRSNRSSHVDTKGRVKLFGKLLIVMGIPFIFEFISALAEGSGYVDAAWYWIVFNVLSMFQGVYIFFIFVFKEDVRRELAEDYSFCQWFGPGLRSGQNDGNDGVEDVQLVKLKTKPPDHR